MRFITNAIWIIQAKAATCCHDTTKSKTRAPNLVTVRAVLAGEKKRPLMPWGAKHYCFNNLQCSGYVLLNLIAWTFWTTTSSLGYVGVLSAGLEGRHPQQLESGMSHQQMEQNFERTIALHPSQPLCPLQHQRVSQRTKLVHGRLPTAPHLLLVVLSLRLRLGLSLFVITIAITVLVLSWKIAESTQWAVLQSVFLSASRQRIKISLCNPDISDCPWLWLLPSPFPSWVHPVQLRGAPWCTHLPTACCDAEHRRPQSWSCPLPCSQGRWVWHPVTKNLKIAWSARCVLKGVGLWAYGTREFEIIKHGKTNML